MANLSLSAKGTIRLTPPLNIPEPLFEEMLDRVERAANITPTAWRMLMHTHLQSLSAWLSWHAGPHDAPIQFLVLRG